MICFCRSARLVQFYLEKIVPTKQRVQDRTRRLCDISVTPPEARSDVSVTGGPSVRLSVTTLYHSKTR